MTKILTVIIIALTFAAGCKSPVKQQQDSIYSRHLQRHIPLEIITTPMPDNKEEMNLLLVNSSDMLDAVRAKIVIDSLYKKKLIQPFVLVAFQGKEGDYGLEEEDVPGAKQYKKFNDFVINELYPFIKKKVVIRKFNSVAICGFRSTAINAFDIAYNNDEKIQSAGIFDPSFFNDSTVMQQISVMRKRPNLKIWLTQFDSGQSFIQFNEIMKTKKSIIVSDNIKGSFADFLLWAFPK